MNRTGKAVSWSVWIGVLLVAAIMMLALLLVRLKSQVGTPPPQLPIIGQVAPFTLTNQVGEPVTLDNLKGRPWVADIIFTRCAGPCPVMTARMRELQAALPAESKARLVTLTTDGDYDTPPVMAKYAEKYNAQLPRWQFLTGEPKDVAALAIDSLKLTAVAKPPEERTDPADLFVHSTIFVIVDKHGQLRGSFQTQGEMVDWSQTKRQVLAALKALEREP